MTRTAVFTAPDDCPFDDLTPAEIDALFCEPETARPPRRTLTVCEPCPPDCECVDCRWADEQARAECDATAQTGFDAGEYTAFMANEAAAAHQRYFTLTTEQRARISSWNAYAERINAAAIAGEPFYPVVMNGVTFNVPPADAA